MTVAAPSPPRRPLEASRLNGDLPLTREQRCGYLRHHAQRNAANAAASRGVRTHAAPWTWPRKDETGSPARVAIAGFLRAAAAMLRRQMGDAPVTILDLGCGSGRNVRAFEGAGFRGRYVGLDLARHRRWRDEPMGPFTRELILGDVMGIDVESLPRADVLVSCTSLEHIEDDAGALERVRGRLAPGAREVHCVPGESALALYGTHGWRQYSPACLRALFPAGTIYRLAGPLSAAVHARCVNADPSGGEPFMRRRPRTYRTLCLASLTLDRLGGGRAPIAYGVVC